MYQETFHEGIEIYNFNFSNTKKAMCYIFDNIKTIALDKSCIESSIEEKILPVSSIKDCLNKNIFDITEMSETLQVPEDFLIYAINMYIEKNQLNYNVKDEFNA